MYSGNIVLPTCRLIFTFIDSTADRLKRKEQELEGLMEEMKVLEVRFNEKEVQNSQFKQQIQKESRKIEESEKAERLNVTVGGYTITTTNSVAERTPPLKRHGTFNAGHLAPVPYDHNAGAIKDLMKIMQKVLVSLKQHSNEIESQAKYIQNIDKDIDQIQKEQKGFKENLVYQMNCFDDHYTDFEDHKKIIQQLVHENNDLQKQVHIVKKVDIPSIRQLLIQRSAMTERPSAPPSHHGQYLGHESHAMRPEQSLNSLDFGFMQYNHDETESDNGLVYKNSILHDLDDINDAESNGDDRSEYRGRRIDDHTDVDVTSLGKPHLSKLYTY